MEVDRIFTAASDWYQMLLYEKHGLDFVTAMFYICSAYVDCGGEIYFVNMFRVISCLYNRMGGHKFTEIV